MTEVWKDIEGYKGLYQISNLGRVKRLEGKGCKQERIIKTYDGWVELSKDCDKAKFSVGYLVANHFLNKTRGYVGRLIHIDGDNDNNCVDNLMWKGVKTVKPNITPQTSSQPDANKGTSNKGTSTTDDLHKKLLEAVTKEINSIDLLELNSSIPMIDDSIVIKDLCNKAFKYITVNPVSVNKWLMKNGVIYDDNNVKVPTIPYEAYYTEKTFKRDEVGAREFHYYAVNETGLSFILDTIVAGIRCGKVKTKLREDKIKVNIEIED